MYVTIYYRKPTEHPTDTQRREVGIDIAIDIVRTLCEQGYVIISVSDARLI